MVCYKDIKVALVCICRSGGWPLLQVWFSDHCNDHRCLIMMTIRAKEIDEILLLLWPTRLFRWWFRATDIKCQNTGKCVIVGRSEHALFGLTEVVNDNLSWFIEEEIDIMRRNWGIRNEEWHCRIGFLPQGLRAGWGGVVFEPPLFRTSGGPAGNRF